MAIWIAGVLVYIVAVLQRTSLGVAGIEATERFGTSAGVLATFAVVQLLVYAALQIPVGILLDRFGSRRLLLAGALTMAAGQVVLALATDFGTAMLARVLVGTGDALTFISVLRLVSAWFPARRIPVMSQFTGITGQLGQVLSAVPLVALLHGPGWTPAFLSTAALSLFAAILALAALRDAPPGAAVTAPAASIKHVGRQLKDSWLHPGTRLGLWTHFVTQFSGTVFVMLWGFPFLVSGQGVAPGTASALITGYVVAGMAFAPLIGGLVARHPLRRSWLVLGVAGSNAVAWAVVLALPGPAPLWLLVALVLILAIGGPGSMIGFDFARTFNPPHRLGTATGIVNVGGFVASLTTILAVGLILDLIGGYSLDAFRVALAFQFVMWTIGIVGVVRTRKLARAELAKEGVVVPPIRLAIRRRLDARRAA